VLKNFPELINKARVFAARIYTKKTGQGDDIGEVA